MQQEKTWAQMREELEAKMNGVQEKLQKPWRDGKLVVKLSGNVFTVTVEDEDTFKVAKMLTVTMIDGQAETWYNNGLQYNSQSLVEAVIAKVF